MVIEKIFKIGVYLLNNKKYSWAKYCFKIGLLFKSSRIECLLNLTYMYQESEKERKKGIKLLEKELSKNYDKELEYQLSFLYSLDNEKIKSLELLKNLFNNDAIMNENLDIQVIEALINRHNELGEYSKAIEVYEQYMKNSSFMIDDNKYLIYYNIGNTYLDSKKYHEAIEAYKNSLKYENRIKFQILFNIGLSFYNLHDYKNAIKYYKMSLETGEDLSDYDFGKAYHAIACVYQELVNKEKANEYLEIARSYGDDWELPSENE